MNNASMYEKATFCGFFIGVEPLSLSQTRVFTYNPLHAIGVENHLQKSGKSIQFKGI